MFYWSKTNLLKSDFKDIIKISDINTTSPKCLDDSKVKYSGPIILRTELSRAETKKY